MNENTTIGISVICDGCGEMLAKPGALLFSPPIPPGRQVEKFHLCWSCYSPIRRSLG